MRYGNVVQNVLVRSAFELGDISAKLAEQHIYVVNILHTSGFNDATAG